MEDKILVLRFKQPIHWIILEIFQPFQQSTAIIIIIRLNLDPPPLIIMTPPQMGAYSEK